MFDNKYGLTDAVLQGRKTMTRRIAFDGEIEDFNTDYIIDGVDKGRLALCDGILIVAKSKYRIGEVLAVAQAYKDIKEYNPKSYEDVMLDQGTICEASHPYSHLMKSGGWNNKMFVRADLMPHQIRITGIKVERLQDISEEDVYKEGFSLICKNNGWGNAAYHWETVLVYYDTLGRTKEIGSRHPREAFAILIDKVSGIDTWQSNPYVFVYTFELIK